MKFISNKELCSRLPNNKREIAEALIEKAEFMEDELEKLQAILKEKGWTEEYQNGANQFGVKKSSEADVYNALIKNYNSTLKQISEIVPDAVTDDVIEKEFFK